MCVRACVCESALLFVITCVAALATVRSLSLLEKNAQCSPESRFD